MPVGEPAWQVAVHGAVDYYNQRYGPRRLQVECKPTATPWAAGCSAKMACALSNCVRLCSAPPTPTRPCSLRPTGCGSGISPNCPTGNDSVRAAALPGRLTKPMFAQSRGLENARAHAHEPGQGGAGEAQARMLIDLVRKALARRNARRTAAGPRAGPQRD